MTGLPHVTVSADGRWATVPVDGESPEEYGPAVVGELGDTVPDESREALGRDLTMWATRAQQVEAVFAAVLLPDPADCVLAYTECLAFDPGEAGLGSDPDAIAEMIGADRVEPPGWREVSRVDLPAGPAVRVHELDAQPDPAGEDAPIVESITHILPVEGTDLGVMLMTSWSALLAAEGLVTEADRLAGSLTVTR